MELHQLRYFCAVAETGSFSRAAEHSHVSQPSLSQQILKLEAELGARLFDRLGRSVRLTEVGKTFLPRARAVLRELEAARGDVVESKDSISGHVAVGAIPTVAPYFLPALLRIRRHGDRRNYSRSSRTPPIRQYRHSYTRLARSWTRIRRATSPHGTTVRRSSQKTHSRATRRYC